MIVDLVRPTSGQRARARQPLPRPAQPGNRVGALLDASGFHPGRSGRNALRVIAAAAGSAARAGRRRRSRWSSSVRRRAARREGLLHRHAAAAGAGRRPARRPARCCCSTSRPTGSTPRASAGCAASCASAPPRDAPCSSRVTCWPRWSRPSTTCSSSARASCSRRGPSAVSRLGLRRWSGRAAPRRERLEALLRERGAAVNRLETALAIRGPSSAEVGELAHANGLVLHELLTEQPSLEDLFLQIAGTRRQS